MNNILRGFKENFKSKLTRVLTVVLVQLAFLLVVVTNSLAILKGDVIIDGEATTIAWGYSSTQLSLDGEKYTLGWSGAPASTLTFDFDISGVQAGVSTEVEIAYEIDVANVTNLPSGVTIAVDANKEVAERGVGIISANSASSISHTITITNTNGTRLVGEDFSFVVNATTLNDCAVSESLSATINVHVPGYVEYSIIDSAGSEYVTLIVETSDSSTGYVNMGLAFDNSALISPTLSGSAKYAKIYSDNSKGSNLVVTLAENSTYVLKFKKINSNTDYSSTFNASNSILSVVSDDEAYLVTFNKNDSSAETGNAGEATIIGLNANNGAYVSGYSSNQPYTYLPTAIWDYHTFNGWFTAASGGKKVSEDMTFPFASLLMGEEVPGVTVGNNGDYYYDSTIGKLYTKTYVSAVLSWGEVANSSGTGGKAVLSTGAGSPSAEAGENGNYYVNTSNSALYYKDGGVWGQVTNIITAGNITLYAQWEVNGVVLTLDGGEYANPTSEWTLGAYTPSNYFNGVSNSSTVLTSNIEKNNYYSAVSKTSGGVVSSLGVLPNPVRDGYTFKGWITSSDYSSYFATLGDAATGAFTTLTGLNAEKITALTVNTRSFNVTLKAIWIANSYTLNYETNGGSAVASTVKTYNEAFSTLPTPTRDGYTFNAWYASSALTGDVLTTADRFNVLNADFDDVATLGSNATIYAKWTANIYNLVFNSNGGSAVSTVEDKAYGSTLTTLPTPTLANFTFVGWYATSSLTGDALATSDVFDTNHATFASVGTPETNATVYAKWTADSIAITLDLNDIDASSANVTAGTTQVYFTHDVATFYINRVNGLSDVVTSITIPSAEGYTFSGYNTAANGSGVTYIDNAGVIDSSLASISSDSTLYAIWTAKIYTLNFYDPATDTIILTISNKAYGTTFGSFPTEPTRSGYTFSGWFSSDSFEGNALTSSSIFDSSNATFANIATAGTTSTLYALWTSNSNIIAITLTANNGPTADDVGSSVIYYAFNENTAGPYFATYSNGKLSNAISSITVPAKAGYTFLGYNTSVDGTGTTYITSEGVISADLYSAISSGTQLYAQWATDITVNILLDGSEWLSSGVSVKLMLGEDVISTVAATSGSSVTFSAIPVNGNDYSYLVYASVNDYSLGSYSQAAIIDLRSSTTANINYFTLNLTYSNAYFNNATGAGVYLNGQTVSPTATVINSDYYTFNEWTTGDYAINGGATVSTPITLSNTTTLYANATNTLYTVNVYFYEQDISGNYAAKTVTGLDLLANVYKAVDQLSRFTITENSTYYTISLPHSDLAPVTMAIVGLTGFTPKWYSGVGVNGHQLSTGLTLTSPTINQSTNLTIGLERDYCSVRYVIGDVGHIPSVSQTIGDLNGWVWDESTFSYTKSFAYGTVLTLADFPTGYSMSDYEFEFISTQLRFINSYDASDATTASLNVLSSSGETYYAQWAKLITITYNGLGTTPSVSSKTIKVNQYLTSEFTSVNATRDLVCEASGWYASYDFSSGSRENYSNILTTAKRAGEYNENSNFTAYAKYPYVVFIDANGLDISSEDVANWTVINTPGDYNGLYYRMFSGDYGDSVFALLPTMENSGDAETVAWFAIKADARTTWYGNEISTLNNNTFGYQDISQTNSHGTNMVLSARRYFTITWNENGGMASASTTTALEGAKLTSPTATKTEGGYSHAATGWGETDNSTISLIMAGNTFIFPSSSQTLYAIYADSYTVNFYLNIENGPSAATMSSSAYWTLTGVLNPYATKDVTIGGTYGTLPTPVATNTQTYVYVFNGWYTSANEINSTSSGTLITASSAGDDSDGSTAVNLYAAWTRYETVAVTFNFETSDVSYTTSSTYAQTASSGQVVFYLPSTSNVTIAPSSLITSLVHSTLGSVSTWTTNGSTSYNHTTAYSWRSAMNLYATYSSQILRVIDNSSYSKGYSVYMADSGSRESANGYTLVGTSGRDDTNFYLSTARVSSNNDYTIINLGSYNSISASSSGWNYKSSTMEASATSFTQSLYEFTGQGTVSTSTQSYDECPLHGTTSPYDLGVTIYDSYTDGPYAGDFIFWLEISSSTHKVAVYCENCGSQVTPFRDEYPSWEEVKHIACSRCWGIYYSCSHCGYVGWGFQDDVLDPNERRERNVAY